MAFFPHTLYVVANLVFLSNGRIFFFGKKEKEKKMLVQIMFLVKLALMEQEFAKTNKHLGPKETSIRECRGRKYILVSEKNRLSI